MEVVFNEFYESFFEDLTDWGKLGSHYGFGGNQRTIVQLFGQLDNTKLHSKCKTPLLFLVQPLLHQGSVSLPQCAPSFFPFV